MEGKTQQTAAAMAGMSERSARKWQSGPLPSETKTERRWRTRPDPFDGVWEEEILPLLQGEAAGRLRATTIIDWLEEQHPGRFSASQLRTLQRRLQDWRALNGPDQEVYFPQEHPPGREAQLDFTHCNSLGITVGGRPYRHLLFQLVLSHSGWRYAEVATGETFLALKQGLQNALWELGGAPRVIRSDNTSAATHEMRRSRGRALNGSYAELLDHYGLESTRINSGESHENGVAEQAHYRLKDAIDQALMLRGSRDFSSLDEYTCFIKKVVDRRNRFGAGKAGAGTATLATPAASSGAGVRQPPGPGAQVEHHPGSGTDLHRALPPHWQGGADPAVRRAPGSVLQGHVGGTHGAGKGRAGGPGRLPPRHRLPGAQARGLRPLPFPGADVSHHDLPAGLRRAAGMAWASVPTWSTCASCTWRRRPWSPRWTAPWPCCWRRADPSTTARSGSWPSPRRCRRRCSACQGCRT